MSRRSSLGGMVPGDGLRSPGGLTLPLPPAYMPELGKPVVRFPPAARPVAIPPFAATDHIDGATNAAAPVQSMVRSHSRQENGPDTLTMHQPRPQKTVSVADIESPARFSFNPPQQQQEQPFHQQVPVSVNQQVYVEDNSGYAPHVRRMSHVSRPSGTPLSQIPERAIYAPPFQPVPLPPQPQGYFPSPYAPGSVFYPTMQGDLVSYGPSLGPLMAPTFVTSAHPPPYMVPAVTVPAPAPGEGNASASTVAHESNGMVYYYDPLQLPPSSGASYTASFAGAPVGGVVGMGGMMTPPNHFFYPPNNNGVYYAAP